MESAAYCCSSRPGLSYRARIADKKYPFEKFGEFHRDDDNHLCVCVVNWAQQTNENHVLFIPSLGE